MAASISSSLYNRLVSVMSVLASGNVLKCCSLCLFCMQTTCILCLTSVFRYRKTCRSYLRPLKMGPTGCPETSVRNYHY